MKLYLKTWRYGGIETTLVYHGCEAVYDESSGTLGIGETLWGEGGAFDVADTTIVTITPGDEFSAVRCTEDCHPDDKDLSTEILVSRVN